MNHCKPLKVSSLVWESSPGQLHKLQAAVLEDLGYAHAFFYFNDSIPPDTDFVFIQGPYGPLLPFIKNLMSTSRSARPRVIYWFQQSLDIQPATRLRQALSPLFSELQRHNPEARWIHHIDRFTGGFFNRKGKRLGFLGDIIWLHEQGMLNVLALSSTIYRDLLAQYGIPSLLVPRGYHPTYGANLHTKRDIAAVWMGKLRTRRRRQAVHGLRAQLQKRGQNMLIFDGVENPFIYGEKRTEILNRAWFVPNIYFSDPSNELSIRFYIAAASGAVVITEPLVNEYSFIPGEHLVEASIKTMPSTMLYYIENEEAWRTLSNNMLAHMKKDLRLEQSITAIMAQAEKMKP